jgi:hypothetical protein
MAQEYKRHKNLFKKFYFQPYLAFLVDYMCPMCNSLVAIGYDKATVAVANQIINIWTPNKHV